MICTCTLTDEAVVSTLDHLHSLAKGDWKLIQHLPRVLWGLMAGKSMMKTLTPSIMKDAFIPVSKEQGLFLYNLARSAGSKTIIEFGSSFGIGTIYLAAAAKDNGGRVITTEIEPSKCCATEENVKKAGLARYVTVLEGDALKTLKGVPAGIDFLFLDGWKDLYNAVLDLLLPKLKGGAIVVGDNINLAEGKDYLSRVKAKDSGFITAKVNNATALSYYINSASD